MFKVTCFVCLPTRNGLPGLEQIHNCQGDQAEQQSDCDLRHGRSFTASRGRLNGQGSATSLAEAKARQGLPCDSRDSPVPFESSLHSCDTLGSGSV
jgi:hypothetical protein